VSAGVDAGARVVRWFRDARRRRRSTDAETRAMYDGAYFGAGRDPLDRMGLSGYERYDRATSNADVAAYLVWRFLAPARSLDVGCALGFAVEAMRELGIDARGVDISEWAVEHAAPGARGHVRVGDLLAGLPHRTGEFDVVTAFEVLEHLAPEDVPAAVAELRRVCGGWLVATIPSVGPNEHGPGGWFNAKVRDEVLPGYLALDETYDGPVPFDDLRRDPSGRPIEGHLTVASFRWWTQRFADAGFERCGVVERRIHPSLARFGLTKYWNLYVLRIPGTAVPDDPVRTDDEVAAVEGRWHLDERASSPEDAERVRESLGLAPGTPLW
jgi:SAM-dependent methyltransferase